VTRLFAVSGPSAVAALSTGSTAMPAAEKVIAFATGENAAAARLLGEQSGADIVFVGADELLVLAEGQVDAERVVSELYAHLQRCPASVCGLVTPSTGLIRQVSDLLKGRSRRGARGAPKSSGSVYLTQTRTLDEAVKIANERGPEHLWLISARPGEVSDKLSAYAVLHVGVNASPMLAEGGLGVGLSVTGGPCPCGPVGVADFIRLTTVHELVPQSYTRLGRALAALARSEGRGQAAEAVERRLKQDVRTRSRR
jgi:histidinol dehydrogenase